MNERLVKRRENILQEQIRIQAAKREALAMYEQQLLDNESAVDARGRLGNLVKQPTRRVMTGFGESKWNLNENEPEDSVQEGEGAEDGACVVCKQGANRAHLMQGLNEPEESSGQEEEREFDESEESAHVTFAVDEAKKPAEEVA